MVYTYGQVLRTVRSFSPAVLLKWWIFCGYGGSNLFNFILKKIVQNYFILCFPEETYSCVQTSRYINKLSRSNVLVKCLLFSSISSFVKVISKDNSFDKTKYILKY